MLGVLLEQEGFELRVVQRGDQVIPMVREFAPAVVLLDIGLPARGGYASCSGFWSRRPG